MISRFSIFVQKITLLTIALMTGIFMTACRTQVDELPQRDPASFAVSSTLSNYSVQAFGEDASGQIWIGTSVGLNRFDGKNYYQYFRVEEPYALSNDLIRSFYTDSKGRFWNVNNSGACFYNQEDAFTRTVLPLRQRASYSMTESAAGDMVLYTMSGQLVVLDEASLTFQEVILSSPLPQCNAVFAAPDGSVVLLANNALFHVDYHTGTVLQRTPFPEGEINTPLRSSALDGNGHLLISAVGGLLCYDLAARDFTALPDWLVPFQGKTVSLVYCRAPYAFIVAEEGTWFYDGAQLHAPQAGGPYDLTDFTPSVLFLDSRDILWAGSSSNGFIRVPYSGSLFNRNRRWSKALDGTPVSRLCYDGTDGLWLISEGLLYHLSADGALVKVDPTPGSDTFQDVAFNPADGQILVARHWDVFAFKYENGKVRNVRKYALPRRVSRLICDGSGRVFAGTYYKGVYQLNPSDGSVREICPPDDSQIFGISGNTLDLFPLKSGELAATMFSEDIQIFAPSTGRRSVLPYRDQIRELYNPLCLMEDKQGNIWFGTLDFGLYRIDKEGKCTMLEGLPCRSIRSIEQAPDGLIWISTARGLTLYDPDSGRIRHYMSTSGTGGDQFSTRSSCQLPDGTVVFGGHHGITTCHPVAAPDESAMPPIVFESLKINNQTVFPSENGPIRDLMCNHPPVRLKHNQNNLAISFALLDYLPSSNPGYRFKLEGHDAEWTEIGDNNTVYFSRLQPGKYTLRVDAEAAGPGNIPESQLSIQVRPPFWWTWFAKVVYMLAALSLVAAYLYYNRRRTLLQMRLEQTEREREHEQEVYRMTYNFFGNMAHEFRSPLTLLEGPLSQLTSEGTLSSGENKLVDVMKASVQRMHRLVNQIIDYNKLENNSLDLHVTPSYDVAALVRWHLDINQVAAQAQHIRTVTQGIDRAVLVPLDVEVFESILTNLLTNAYKFVRQEDGEIHLCLSTLPADGLSTQVALRDGAWQGRYITLAVENNGLPIDPAELEHVFDRYYQLREHGWNARRVGSGIGLAFARTLAELHHGYLWAENPPEDAGVRFTLALPAEQAAYRTEELDAAPAEPLPLIPKFHLETTEPIIPASHKASVMIVDDDIDIANYEAMLLGDEYRTLVCYNAGQALEALQTKMLPDIILSDIMMPGIDGIQLCKIVKAQTLTRHIPFVLITAKDDLDFKVEGLDSGADAYFAKPFDPIHLRAQIRSLLKNRILSSGETADAASILQIDLAGMNERDRELIGKIGTILQKEISNPDFDVNGMAARLGMSRSKLFYRIKELTGMSPNDLIRKFRMETAAQLLREGKSNVSEVAYAVGISSLSYFSKVFRLYFGVLPKDAARM